MGAGRLQLGQRQSGHQAHFVAGLVIGRLGVDAAQQVGTFKIVAGRIKHGIHVDAVDDGDIHIVREHGEPRKQPVEVVLDPGANPQNHPLMVIHPPMLYAGYVGFTVPFAFAVAALVTGRLGEGWLVETRRWTLLAWGFLSVGIVLGCLVELRSARVGRLLGVGPGRERVVPPVALTATAFIHSVMVQERRGMLARLEPLARAAPPSR